MTREARSPHNNNPIVKLIHMITYFIGSFFWNRDAPEPSDWFEPDLPEWRRWASWWLRNWAHDFRAYIIGIEDRDFTVHYWTEVEGNFDYERINHGWTAHHLTLDRHPIYKFPYIGYTGGREYGKKKRRFQWHLGWMDSGRFGIKARFFRKEVER